MLSIGRKGEESIYTPFAIIDKVNQMKGNKAKRMKGLELPINMIVVIAIAVLVLVAVGALFSGWLGGGSLDQRREASLNSACNLFTAVYNCDVSRMGDAKVQHQDAGDATPVQKSLSEMCALKSISTSGSNKGTDINQCARRCGCPVGA